MAAKIVRVGVLRFRWIPLAPEWMRGVTGEAARPVWPDDFLHEVFQANNGWSIRDYWLRCSFGLLQLEFDFRHAAWRKMGDHRQQDLSDRGAILQAARDVMVAANVSLDGFDQVLAFVHPPPSNAGAISGGAVFDQGGSIPFFQHEFGHVLGFQHAFGPFIPPPNEFGSLYNDDYCVMGYTGPQSHPIDPVPEFDTVDLPDRDGFWRSERRPSGAALYRRFTGTDEFVESGWVAHVDVGQRVWVTALGEADTVGRLKSTISSARGARPIVAVLPAPGRQGVTLAVEYRTATNDDAGVTPAVVVHSIGANYVGDGRGEVNPPWLEATLAPEVGQSATVLGVKFEIVALDTGAPAGAEILISKSVLTPVTEASKEVHIGAGGPKNP